MFSKTTVTLFIAGDVMVGRGIDQILAQPCNPEIYEPFLKNAQDYVKLAIEKNGPIRPFPVGFDYIWGDALGELTRVNPDFRIINLETAVTRSDEWVSKGINYRMSPENVLCLRAAQISCCALANNHVLDWGEPGLIETLQTLNRAEIQIAGAGRDLKEAQVPAGLEFSARGRVLVFSAGLKSSGIPSHWAATEDQAGVWLLNDLSQTTIRQIGDWVRSFKRKWDLVLFSVHWGSNWGYEISREEIEFARGLIEDSAVDLIHGHSSHHPKAFEVYRGKLILYGCGDLINDYEGISGYEEFRSDLGLMYFVTLHTETGSLAQLELVPIQMRRLQVRRAKKEDSEWLETVLNREGERFGSQVTSAQGRLYYYFPRVCLLNESP